MVTQEHLWKNRALDRSVMDHEVPTVFVIDPDPSTVNIVSGVLTGSPFDIQTFISGREFFAAYNGIQPGCLVLEQRIADTSGLQIQRRLAERRQRLPMIYVSSSIDVSTAVVLMRAGRCIFSKNRFGPSNCLAPFRRRWPSTKASDSKRPTNDGFENRSPR